MTLHENEIPVGETLVRSLLKRQRPEWAGLPLAAAGAGTDNTMYRLGDDLLVRLPRTPDNGRSLRKEREWLPRLAPFLKVSVPEPVHAGTPTEDYPAPWSVYRWIDGAEAGPDTVRDWAAFGADLAEFVRALHAAGLMGASRSADSGLDWYRGGALAPCDDWIAPSLDDCRALLGEEFDVDALVGMWRAGLALPEPSGPHGWLHGDLRPANLLVRDGRLCAVIDFGGLSVGHPDAEHAAVWDLPAEARQAYWDALGLDEATWIRARAWAVGVAASGVAYYRDGFPAFVAECRTRLRHILADARAR
ncbi:aminoglycoside phosphotransferase family protein [Streptomyces tritici]|uniref:aminoglycoside phosphotransferase family protein n=1 Tax=Streptomyces tritici TaxID=2054410 RepID=UPI003AEF2385